MLILSIYIALYTTAVITNTTDTTTNTTTTNATTTIFTLLLYYIQVILLVQQVRRHPDPALRRLGGSHRHGTYLVYCMYCVLYWANMYCTVLRVLYLLPCTSIYCTLLHALLVLQLVRISFYRLTLILLHYTPSTAAAGVPLVVQLLLLGGRGPGGVHAQRPLHGRQPQEVRLRLGGQGRHSFLPRHCDW